MLANELKGLNTRRVQLEIDLKHKIDARNLLEKEEFVIRNDLRSVEDKIKRLTERTRDLIFSEHAMLRYFERVLGYDMEKVREAIVPLHLREVFKLRTGMQRVADSHMVGMRNGTVTTVGTIAEDNSKGMEKKWEKEEE